MLLTIFTPTYNRANKLRQIYNSLKSQHSNEYEWLIVDDGSKDKTEQVVLDFLKFASFDIRYVKKENGGKHTAHNVAVDLAKGKYFMCLDSDDYMNEKAINGVLDTIHKCHIGEGIIAYKCDQMTHLLSDKFPQDIEISNSYSLESQYNCRGEFVFVYPTEILRKNKFPIFDGEKFLTESILYDKIKCPMRLLPQVIEVCEYQTDGLSNNLNEIMKKNPAGYCLYFMQRIDMQKSIKDKIITAGKYLCFSFLAGKNRSPYTGKHKWLVLSCYPLGIATLLYYKIVRKF